MGNGADDNRRSVLGISFDPKITTGTLLVIAGQIIVTAFVAGVLWTPVSTAPGQITELRATVTKGFDEVSKDLNALRLQTAAIANLDNREQDLAKRQSDTDGRVSQLRVDVGAIAADIANIKETSKCLPGDQRRECGRRN